MKTRKERKRQNKIIAVLMIFMIAITVNYGLKAISNKTQAPWGNISSNNSQENQNDNAILNPEEKEGKVLTCRVLNTKDNSLVVFVTIGKTEVLYGTGYKKNAEKIIKSIDPAIIGKLDYLIIPNSNSENAGGASKIIEKYNVGEVITSGENAYAGKEYKKALKEAKSRNCKLTKSKDIQYELDSLVQLNIIDCLGPEDKGSSNPNNLSVIANIIYGTESILITGDSEFEAEKNLVSKVGETTLLIGGHHLGSTSFSKVFLNKVSPSYIFTAYAKDNKEGYPSEEALKRCVEITESIYSTANSGELKFTATGTGEVEMEAGEDTELNITE